MENEKGINEKFTKGTKKLDQVLNSQRSSRNKTGLGYSTSKGSSMGKMNFSSAGFEEPQSYAKMYQERINEDKNLAIQRGSHH